MAFNLGSREKRFFYDEIMAPTVQAMKTQFKRDRREQTVREDVMQRELLEERQKQYWDRNERELRGIANAEVMMRSQFRAAAKQQRRKVNEMRGVAKQLGRQLELDTHEI